MKERHLALLDRDLLNSAEALSASEARYLVDLYYTFQEDRIRADAQVRALEEGKEPHALLNWTGATMSTIEEEIKKALDRYSRSNPLGRWARSQKGVGPVIAAGLLAHIDLTKARTAGQVWRFAGLDPSVTWSKGEKRPWNAKLKVLCWKLGESFVKVSGKDDAFYGRMYLERKAQEEARNLTEANREAATHKLDRVGKTTQAYAHYAAGHLPPGHVHARAKRAVVKLFLSHYHTMGYRLLLGQEPPVPYVMAFGGHTGYIPPPPGEKIVKEEEE